MKLTSITLALIATVALANCQKIDPITGKPIPMTPAQKAAIAGAIVSAGNSIGQGFASRPVYTPPPQPIIIPMYRPYVRPPVPITLPRPTMGSYTRPLNVRIQSY